MKKTTIAFTGMTVLTMAALGLFLYSCNEDNSNPKEQDTEVKLDYKPANLPDLVGEWEYDSGEFNVETTTGVDSFKSSIIKKVCKIELKENKYFFNYYDFIIIELSPDKLGANAITPQQMKYSSTDAGEALYMAVKSGTVRKLSSGQIETKFRLTGEEDGDKMEMIITGIATRKEK